MSAKKSNQSKTLSTFGLTTLLKLAELEAARHYGGKFTILSEADGFKAFFGVDAPATDAEHQPAMKEAVMSMLAKSPGFAESEAKSASVTA